MPSSLSPASSCMMLDLFSKRKLQLTREQYDTYFDAVIAVLDAANNEVFRLEEDTTEGQ